MSLGELVEKKGRIEFHTLGSGIVIVSPDLKSACLLTARHMFVDPSKGYKPDHLSLRVPPPAGQGGGGLGVVLQLVRDGKQLWFSPPDDADLAAIPVPKMGVDHILHAIPVTDIGGGEDLYQGASVLVLGYPALVSEGFLETPLARGGIVAWDNPVAPTRNPFLVDANLYPGNSGGPVFHVQNGMSRSGGFVVGGRVTLIGIVSQGAILSAGVFANGQPVTAVDPVTGKSNPEQAQVVGIGGLGIIEPIARAEGILKKCLGT
jgi:hypothetical protein